MRSMLTLALLSAASLTLTGCGTLTVSNKTSSTAPIVACGEDTKGAPFPAAIRMAGGTEDALERATWAVRAAAAYQSQTILRDKTAQCLADLRKQGIIN